MKDFFSKINWDIRFSDPVFVGQVFLGILLPIAAYFGLTGQDLTTWNVVGGLLLDALKNPYVLFMCVVNVYNIVKDPTTPGFADSERALHYIEQGTKPEKGEDE